MKKIILIGAGGQCRSLISIINSIGSWKIHGIIDIKYKNQEEMIMDIPVIGGLEKLSNFDNKEYSLALAIGDNTMRKKIKILTEDKKYDFPNLVHPLAYVDSNIDIGIGNVISCFSFIGPMVKIGDFNIINTDAKLEHDVVLGNFNHIAPSSTVCGRVHINNEVLLGAGSVVIPKIKITSKVTIGANATLVKDITKQKSIHVGTPAIEK